MDDEQVTCDACADTGWRVVDCDGLTTVKMCGRRRLHAPHESVKPCECRPINRTYQERRERMRTSAA